MATLPAIGGNTHMYVAGWNMPGYLPEMTPEQFDTFDEAKRFIIDELLFSYTITESEETATEMSHLAEDVNLESSDFEVSAPDGYVYWVTREIDE